MNYSAVPTTHDALTSHGLEESAPPLLVTWGKGKTPKLVNLLT